MVRMYACNVSTMIMMMVHLCCVRSRYGCDSSICLRAKAGGLHQCS